ncbi:four and a half LIM domains protein 3-like, partial [Rhopilema esculentum]|uniref:four and a half LIM domains protein 3-like n=1 Tax=Rhopilema esculentum TaxID=499914 RepID=UPI0031DC70B7
AIKYHQINLAANLQESQTFVCVNNELVCNSCRGIDPPKICAGCTREFMPEEKKIGVKENNEYYHELCFLCSKCNNPIGTQQFVRTGPGTQTCNSCYQSRLQDCIKCAMAIKGNVVKFEGMPYHPECFICEQCRVPLSGMLFALLL